MRSLDVNSGSQPIRNQNRCPRPAEGIWLSSSGGYQTTILPTGSAEGGPASRIIFPTALASGGVTQFTSQDYLTTDIPVKPGDRVQAMIRAWTNQARSEVCCEILWINSAGAIISVVRPPSPIASMTWTWLSNSAIAPVDAVAARTGFRVNTLAGTTDGFELRADLAFATVNGPKPEQFNDGYSFGWKWDGTPGLSTSVGYPQSPRLIRNLSIRPIPSGPSSYLRAASGGSSASAAFVSGIGPANTPAIRWTITSDASGASAAASDLLQMNASPVITGKSYSLGVWVRSSRATVLRAQLQFINSAGGNAGNPQGPDTPVPANVWTRLIIEGKVAPAGALTVRADVDHGIGAGTWLTGDLLDATMVMVVEGDTLPVYSDGNTPGWRWEGTVGQSASTGYPYTLEGAAGGSPFTDMTAPGTVQLDGSTSTKPISLYLVADHLADPGLFGDYNTGINVNNTTGLTRLTGLSISRTASVQLNAVRLDTNLVPSGSGFNQTLQMTVPAPAVGRHCTVARLNNGMTLRKISIDGRIVAGSAAIPNNGIERYQMVVDSGSGLQAPVRLLHFEAEHDDATCIAVQKWLANKYGFALAA